MNIFIWSCHKGLAESKISHVFSKYILLKWRWCAKPISTLLGPHQLALARLKNHDDHTAKKTVRTMWKSQIHSYNIRNSGIYIELKKYSPDSATSLRICMKE